MSHPLRISVRQIIPLTVKTDKQAKQQRKHIHYANSHKSDFQKCLFPMSFSIRAFVLMTKSNHYSEYWRQIYTSNLLRVLQTPHQKDYSWHVNHLAVWKLGYLPASGIFKVH